MCSEAGAVALIADHHYPPGRAAGGGDPVGAGRVKPPLQNVSVDNHCARKIAVAVPLVGGPGVNDQCARCHLPLKIRRVHPLKPGAALEQQLVHCKWCLRTARA